MPEISVIFPPADVKSDIVTATRVLTPTLIAEEHEPLRWIFYNCDPRIQSAEIEFADGAHMFFEFALPNGASGATSKFRKPITEHGHIYGTVPTLIANRPVIAKYSIRGFDLAGHKCSEIDPEILINEP